MAGSSAVDFGRLLLQPLHPLLRRSIPPRELLLRLLLLRLRAEDSSMESLGFLVVVKRRIRRVLLQRIPPRGLLSRRRLVLRVLLLVLLLALVVLRFLVLRFLVLPLLVLPLLVLPLLVLLLPLRPKGDPGVSPRAAGTPDATTGKTVGRTVGKTVARTVGKTVARTKAISD
jgi:hypothetical protein